MAVTLYPYAISAFTGLIPPYTKPDLGRLTQEIQVSAIVTALDHIDGSDSGCDIWFKAALDTADEALLSSIVADHSGEPLTPPLPVQPVRSIDTEGLDPDTALSCTEGLDFVVKAGQDMTEENFSFPYSIDVVAARYVIDDTNGGGQQGDKVDVFGIPPTDPDIDAAVQAVVAGQAVVPVSGSMFSDQVGMKPGLWVKFAGHATEYRVDEVDEEANTITLHTVLTAGVAQYEAIKIRRPFLINCRVRKGILYPIGDLTSGSP